MHNTQGALASTMEVQQVLHMNGGEGETSYSNNSLPQRSVIFMTKPILEEAIQQLCSTTITKTMSIADLGCSSGPNSFLPITMIIDAVQDSCIRSGRPSPEFLVFLNDLPGSDFNSLFKTTTSSYERLRAEKGDELGRRFIAGVPGSFYGRLFPIQSLHFVYSANSLHWLSQVPLGFGGDMSDLNKGNIALGSTSPLAAFDAYLQQFRRDFTVFLKSRSMEVVHGGRMVLSLLGRRTEDPFARECHHLWDDLARALRDMVAKGIVKQEKMDSFGMPYYAPHINEIRDVIEKEGSFDIIRLEERHRDSLYDNTNSKIDNETNQSAILMNNLRAVTEPMLVDHFGPTMIGELFKKLEENMSSDRGARKNYVFLVVSLTRK